MKLEFSAGWLAVMAFYLAGIVPARGAYLTQLIAISLLVAFGVFVAIKCPKNPFKEEQKTLFWILGVIGPFLSAVNSVIYENYSLIAYATLFAMTIFSAKMIATRYDFNRLASLYIYACAFLAISLVATDFNAIRTALSATQTESGLYRLTPFGNHPNLAAHFFGIAAALLVARTLRINTRVTYLTTIPLFLVFLAILLATSSRGSILALLVTTAIIGVITRPNDRASTTLLVHKRTALIFASLLITTLVLVWKSNYLFEMLDINSTSRGVDSGGTGRFQNWATFISKLDENPAILFFGHGFRSWPIDKMGFDTDNSYITLIYEIGLPLTLVLIILLAKVLTSAIRRFDAATMSPEAIAVLSFALIESVFARYLVSIGNPGSFIVLTAFLAIHLPPPGFRKRQVGKIFSSA